MTSAALSALQIRSAPLNSTLPPLWALTELPSAAVKWWKVPIGKAGPAARRRDQPGGRTCVYARIEPIVRSRRAGEIDRKSSRKIDCFIARVCSYLMLFTDGTLHAARIFLSLRLLPTGSSLFAFARGGKSGQQRAMYWLSAGGGGTRHRVAWF